MKTDADILKTLPILDTPAKCAALWPEYQTPVIALWATGSPIQTVDVLWRLRSELLKAGLPVVFFFTSTARPMLEQVLSDRQEEKLVHVYQFDDVKLFRFLSFVEILVSHDFNINMDDLSHIGAKLVSLPHHAGVVSPFYWNRSWDYIVTEKEYFSDLPYEFFPNKLKIHRNRHLTLLNAGHPKLDLLLEERQKVANGKHPPILLLFPTGIDYTLERYKLDRAAYERIWVKIANDFMEWQPDSLVVYRPLAMDRSHAFHKRIREAFAKDARFFIDEDDNNKFWLARADYFVSCESDGFVNFCLTSQRPAVRLLPGKDQEVEKDDWGWEVTHPAQVLPLLKEAERDKGAWEKHFSILQKKEMPALGESFPLLAGMIERIYNNNDDPAWPKMDKLWSQYEKPAKDLVSIGKMLNRGWPELHQIYNDALLMEKMLPASDNRKWLLLLRSALLGNISDVQRLDVLVRELLEKAEFNQPFERVVKVIRHCFNNKDPETVAIALLAAAASTRITGFQKKRALFFFLMECPELKGSLDKFAELVQKRPNVYSLIVAAKLNRYLPLAMRLPLSVRRFGAKILGIKHPLAKKYWKAHCKLPS